MSRRRLQRQSPGAIFAIPALLAASTLAGLVAGLMGDGWYDCAAAIGLGLPVVVMAVRIVR